MKRLTRAWWLSLGAGACCLGAALGTAIHPAAAAAPLLVAAGWWFGQRKGWRWTDGAGFLFIFVGVLIAALAEAAPGWLIAAALLGIAAWDLAHFRQLINGKGEEGEAEQLINRHFRLLGFSLVMGGGLTYFALRLTIDYRFLWLLGLAVVLIMAMRQLVSSLPGRE